MVPNHSSRSTKFSCENHDRAFRYSFVNLTDEAKTLENHGGKRRNSKEKMLEMTIEELDLSVRSYNCLKRAALILYKNLQTKSEPEMIQST